MSDEVLENELENEFGMFGIDIAGNIAVLEKLTGICRTHKLNSDDIVAKWFTYNKLGGQVITPEILDEFERKLSTSEKRTPSVKKISAPRRPNTYDANTIKQIISQDDNDEDDMLGSYATPSKSRKPSKRLNASPEQHVHNKRVHAINGTPQQVFSPASKSPDITTPSLKYESRIGRGDVLFSFGISGNVGLDWKGCCESINIKPMEDGNVPVSYKYMFQKLQDKANVLNEMIRALSCQMKDNLLLDEYETVSTQTQEDITVCGRICCDAVGRLNSKSVVLEGCIEISGGQKTPLDLTNVNNYSLFPGQIVALQGKNSCGTKILPSSIYNGCKLPFSSSIMKGSSINESHFTVYVVCGPYATNDSTALSYTPLEDLMDVVKIEAPDILIMLGPFVDSKHILIQTGKIDFTFDELFSFVCDKVTSAVKNLRTDVIFVPSQRDVCHDFVYPQPPFIEEPTKRIKMMSDPSTFMINDVCFGLTSTDILFHLGGEEVSSFNVKSDRLGRLADHLLRQQCYYPLYPPSQEVNMDYEQFENYCFMPVSPDILIVPSDLRYFAKDIDGCLCVNPGRLVKGQTGGTFLKLLVKPKKTDADKSIAVSKSIAQIVRI